MKGEGMKNKWVGVGVAVIALAGCATLAGSVTTVVKMADASGHSVVQCLSSSSGFCHVQIGEPGSSGIKSYSVPVGGELSVALPDAPVPFCASPTPGWAFYCSMGPKNLVSKNGVTVLVKN